MKRAFFTLVFTLAAAFQAAPSMAQGAPQPGTQVWLEDFSSGSPLAGSTAVNIEAYSDVNSVPYTVGTGWDSAANECNGWILNSGTAIPGTDSGCGINGGRTGTGTNTQIAWLFLRDMADALGKYQDNMPAGTNNVLASMTNPGPGGAATIPNPVQIQADSVAPVTAGHYYMATTDFAEIHCNNDTYKPVPIWYEAAETIFLLNGATQATLVQSPLIKPCDDAPGNPYVTTSVGTPVYITRGATPAWLATGGVSTVGIKITNDTAATIANDVAIDRLRIIDVTPHLSEAFDQASIPVGGTATLTFTITNTDDLLAKDGWSMTETLPAGLTMVGTPTTTCTNGVVTTSGAAGFTVTADMEDAHADLSKASCTITMVVTSSTDGTYTNGEEITPGTGGITGLNGLLPPSPARLRVGNAASAPVPALDPKALGLLAALLALAFFLSRARGRRKL